MKCHNESRTRLPLFCIILHIFTLYNFFIWGLYNYVFCILYSSFSRALFHIFPFIFFSFYTVCSSLSHLYFLASLVSLVFSCVIAFPRYLAYKYCSIPCFCTMLLRMVTVSDRNCLAICDRPHRKVPKSAKWILRYGPRQQRQ